MKVYTRKGDEGQTGLLGGTRVPKHHPRIEAYGTLDELNSFIGLLHDHVADPPARALLQRIQSALFAVGRYRTLNTFIDDLFAFVIKMPTMHRFVLFLFAMPRLTFGE